MLQWGLEEQRRSIFVDAALNAPDQLRQRMAWALSQILVVSPGSVDGNDYTEPFLSYYDIFIRHAFGNYFDILKEVTYHPLMAEMLTYLNGEVSCSLMEKLWRSMCNMAPTKLTLFVSLLCAEYWICLDK